MFLYKIITPHPLGPNGVSLLPLNCSVVVTINYASFDQINSLLHEDHLYCVGNPNLSM